MKRIGRKQASGIAKVLALALGLLIVLSLEGAVRLFVPETHLDKITNILVQDPVMFWRNRGNLDTVFAGEKIATSREGFRVAEKRTGKFPAKAPGEFRVVCMGASPTFGWGVKYEETYSHRLEENLRGRAGGSAEVIDCGMIGHSSHQGRILLVKEILALRPDAITVSYVINDIDKYRFFRSDGRPDAELEPLGRGTVLMKSVLGKSRFFKLYEKSLNYVIGRRTSFEGKPVAVYRPREVRVPPQDYRENLRGIAAMAEENGIALFLIKMPVNLPEMEELPEEKKAEAERLRGRGVEMAEKGECGEAAALLGQAVELNPYLSEAHYFLGVCALKRGDRAGAEKAFSDAFESEAHRCGTAGKAYNTILEETARELGVPMVDVVEAFERHDDEYLFISPETDPIHPNAKGHRIIGDEIFKVMEEAGMSPAMESSAADSAL